MSGGLLADGDRRSEPRKQIDVGLGHLPHELPSVGRKAFEVSALAFGKKGVESKRAFAATAYAGKANQLVSRQLQADVPEVVLPRPANDDRKISLWAFLDHRREAPALIKSKC